MRADEFLSLVERHPLPWTAGATPGEPVAYWYADGGSLDSDDGSDALADAAPALAAAAIRLLRHYPPYGETQADADALAALRAALPEDMRP